MTTTSKSKTPSSLNNYDAEAVIHIEAYYPFTKAITELLMYLHVQQTLFNISSNVQYSVSF